MQRIFLFFPSLWIPFNLLKNVNFDTVIWHHLIHQFQKISIIVFKSTVQILLHQTLLTNPINHYCTSRLIHAPNIVAFSLKHTKKKKKVYFIRVKSTIMCGRGTLFLYLINERTILKSYDFFFSFFVFNLCLCLLF